MAYKLMLNIPFDGMSHMWNVSNHVGDAQSCTNNSVDVDLVKILLGEWIRIIQPTVHPSCKEVLRVNGQMDVNTAYWIRATNSSHTRKLDFADAGTISGARASTYVDNCQA